MAERELAPPANRPAKGRWALPSWLSRLVPSQKWRSSPTWDRWRKILLLLGLSLVLALLLAPPPSGRCTTIRWARSPGRT